MPFPTTLNELREQGYKFSERRQCNGCPALIEFWIAPKSGKRMPLEVDNRSGHILPHWTICPKAKQFRRPA